MSSFDDNATSSVPDGCTSSEGSTAEGRRESGQGKARNIIVTILLALARAGNNEINRNSYIPEDIDSDSDCDSDYSDYRYNIVKLLDTILSLLLYF